MRQPGRCFGSLMLSHRPILGPDPVRARRWLPMGTFHAAAVVWKRVPLLVRAGMLCGLVTGLGVGAIGSPLAAGLLGGALVGGIVGTIAGFAMHRTEQRRDHRTKELDDVIGVTSGSLGVTPGSIPPGDLRRDPEEALDLESWTSEWLTPPPPALR